MLDVGFGYRTCSVQKRPLRSNEPRNDIQGGPSMRSGTIYRSIYIFFVLVQLIHEQLI